MDPTLAAILKMLQFADSYVIPWMGVQDGPLGYNFVPLVLLNLHTVTEDHRGIQCSGVQIPPIVPLTYKYPTVPESTTAEYPPPDGWSPVPCLAGVGCMNSTVIYRNDIIIPVIADETTVSQMDQFGYNNTLYRSTSKGYVPYGNVSAPLPRKSLFTHLGVKVPPPNESWEDVTVLGNWVRNVVRICATSSVDNITTALDDLPLLVKEFRAAFVGDQWVRYDHIRYLPVQAPSTFLVSPQWERQASFRVTVSGNLLTIDTISQPTAFSVTYGAFEYSAPESQYTVTITLPLYEWDTQRELTLVASPRGGTPVTQRIKVPAPTGCDLAACPSCPHRPRFRCESKAIKAIYSFVITVLILISLTVCCIIMPWIYTSARIGYGIYWTLSRGLYILTYGVLRTLLFVKYMFTKSTPQSEQRHTEESANLTKRKNRAMKRLVDAQAARRHGFLLASILIPLASADCTTGVGFLVDTTVCKVDSQGVQTCSAGASGQLALRGIGDSACLLARSEAGRVLGQLEVSYKELVCEADLDYQYTTGDFWYRVGLLNKCGGTDSCPRGYACSRGGEAMFPGWGPDICPQHPDVFITCDTHSGCRWNGCNDCHAQCTWICITPELSDDPPAEVSILGPVTCTSKISVLGRNMEPETVQTITLVDNQQASVGPWTLVNLGTLNLNEIWPNYRTVLKLADGRASLANDSPGAGSSLGALGDLKCPHFADYQRGLPNCRVVVDPIFTTRNQGLAYVEQPRTFLRSMGKYLKSLPFKYAGTEASMTSDGRISFKVSKAPTALVSVSAPGNVTITVSTGEVCPEGSFQSAYGTMGADGGNLVLRLRAGCSPGWVTALSQDPRILVPAPSLRLTADYQDLVLPITSTVQVLDFTLTILSETTRLSLHITGELARKDPVIPDAPHGDIPSGGHARGSKEAGFSWPKFWTYTGISSGLLLLICCALCCGPQLLSCATALFSCCRRSPKQVIELQQAPSRPEPTHVTDLRRRRKSSQSHTSYEDLSIGP